MSAIIHKFNKSSPSNSDQYKQLIEKVARCLNEELSELIGNMFDGADDMLFQLAENADSNEDQNEYFDTMRMLRIERKNIGQNFATNLKSYLQPKTGKEENSKELDDSELSLVDQDEMEEMVAVSAMHSKAMSLYGEAVNHLEARFEFLSMKSTRMFDNDALAPKNICESFKDALTDIELSTNNKLVLYKLFDQEVIINLASLYKNLNQLFIEQGILPQIKLGDTPEKISRTIQTAASAPEPAPPISDPEREAALYTQNAVYNPGNNSPQASYQQSSSMPMPAISSQPGMQAPVTNQAHNGSMPTAENMLGNTVNQQVHRVVSQFISGERTASGEGIPSSFTTSNRTASPGTQYYDRRDVMHALSNLQANVAQSNEPVEQINAADFKRALLADMGSRSGGAVTKQVNQIDEKTIDFIEMLFEAIVEDGSISEPVTNLLLRLQIPVIKVAMLDKDFFVDGEHPCRETLNMIAHLGRGIATREDEVFISIDQVVEHLLNEFDVDIDSFETAITQLEIIEQQDIESAAQKEKQTQKDVLQAHAREVVLTELQYHVMNKTLPKPSQKLILKHWSTLMFHQYIKLGKGSEEWQASVSLIKQLINLLQPLKTAKDRSRLTSSKDEVLDQIHNMLLDTRQSPVELETEINQVFLYFENMLDNSQFDLEQSENPQEELQIIDDANDITSIIKEFDTESASENDAEEVAIDPLQEQARLSREKIAKLPSDVRPGVWFEVHTGNESALRRAKLSVIIMEEAKLVFVDRMGVKVIEKDAEAFTSELEQNKSNAISDHSAFDHALGMVINSLSTNK